MIRIFLGIENENGVPFMVNTWNPLKAKLTTHIYGLIPLRIPAAARQIPGFFEKQYNHIFSLIQFIHSIHEKHNRRKVKSTIAQTSIREKRALKNFLYLPARSRSPQTNSKIRQVKTALLVHLHICFQA